jgi:hypothetical protein
MEIKRPRVRWKENRGSGFNWGGMRGMERKYLPLTIKDKILHHKTCPAKSNSNNCHGWLY